MLSRVLSFSASKALCHQRLVWPLHEIKHFQSGWNWITQRISWCVTWKHHGQGTIQDSPLANSISNLWRFNLSPPPLHIRFLKIFKVSSAWCENVVWTSPSRTFGIKWSKFWSPSCPSSIFKTKLTCTDYQLSAISGWTLFTTDALWSHWHRSPGAGICTNGTRLLTFAGCARWAHRAHESSVSHQAFTPRLLANEGMVSQAA